MLPLLFTVSHRFWWDLAAQEPASESGDDCGSESDTESTVSLGSIGVLLDSDDDALIEVEDEAPAPVRRRMATVGWKTVRPNNN